MCGGEACWGEVLVKRVGNMGWGVLMKGVIDGEKGGEVEMGGMIEGVWNGDRKGCWGGGEFVVV